jgi:hypothetical protein
MSVYQIGAATFHSCGSSVILMRLSGPRSDPLLLRKCDRSGNRTRVLWVFSREPWQNIVPQNMSKQRWRRRCVPSSLILFILRMVALHKHLKYYELWIRYTVSYKTLHWTWYTFFVPQQEEQIIVWLRHLKSTSVTVLYLLFHITVLSLLEPRERNGFCQYGTSRCTLN